MKKKFLSLMMAAAVVATTSVSAFAADKVIDSADNQKAQSEVTITGNVQDAEGRDPVGTFKVTVPTTAKFTVTKAGVVLSANLEVKNAGSQEIEVYAHKFVDHSGSGDISLVDEDTLTQNIGSKKNSNVALKLTSTIGDEVAYLSSDSSKGGVYTDVTLRKPATDLGVKLLTLPSGTDAKPASGQIIVGGKAGKLPEEKAISDEFTLTLKIKKVDNKVSGSSQGEASDQSPSEDEVAHQ